MQRGHRLRWGKIGLSSDSRGRMLRPRRLQPGREGRGSWMKQVRDLARTPFSPASRRILFAEIHGWSKGRPPELIARTSTKIYRNDIERRDAIYPCKTQ